MSLHMITYVQAMSFVHKFVTEFFNFDFCNDVKNSKEKLNLEVRSSLLPRYLLALLWAFLNGRYVKL